MASNKRRAQETIAPLSTELGLDTEVIPDLVEINRYAKIYAPPPMLKERSPDYFETMVRGDFEAIGWDSYETFRERVLAAWQELTENPRGAQVVVACHGGTIRVILTEILGIPTHGLFEPTPVASITRTVVEEGKVRLRSLHEISHFDGKREGEVGPEGTGVLPA